MRPTTPGTLNSSGGFKAKRPLLPKIRKDEQSKDNKQLPRLLQSNAQIANPALFKSYLTQLQDSINQLDLDRKLRSSQSQFSSHGYIMTLRKWVKEVWDRSTERQDNLVRVLAALESQSVEDAFMRLYRMFASIDVLTLKATELMALSILKYEDTLIPLFQEAGIKLSGFMSTGVVVSKFNLLHLLLERQQGLIELALRKKRESGPTVNKQNNSNLIDSLKSKINDLQAQLQNAQRDLVVLKRQHQSTLKLAQERRHEPKEVVTTNRAVPKGLLEQASKELLQQTESAMTRLREQLQQSRSQNLKLKAELLAYKNESYIAKHERQPKDAFEACVLSELQLMRNAFLQRIKGLEGHHEQVSRELSKKEAQARREMQSCKYERDMLLKKWQMLKE